MRLEPTGWHRQRLRVYSEDNWTSTVSLLYKRSLLGQQQQPWLGLNFRDPTGALDQKLGIPKPFRDNYTRFFYSNYRYFSTFLHVKLNEEFDGASFKAIDLVCGEQLPKNANHVFGGNVYKHYNKLMRKHLHMLLCFSAVLLSIETP